MTGNQQFFLFLWQWSEHLFHVQLLFNSFPYQIRFVLKSACPCFHEVFAYQTLRRRMLYPAELCRHTIFGLKSRLFSLFDHPDRWPIFSIFSRYFFRRKCYLRPLQHLAFLIKILSTELPSTPEYFSKVLSTGPPLGARCWWIPPRLKRRPVRPDFPPSPDRYTAWKSTLSEP